MRIAKFFILILICLFFETKAQQTAKELQKFTNQTLFDLKDSTCTNLTGEWTGEEVQYDATQSFIKVKFKVVFKLKQEGNRVYGTSFIQDKFRGSYGDMKIRGIVSGNKLYFEEYEIVDEKFYQLNVVWCLRSGEMDIKTNENTIILDGLHYDGYASNDYRKCTDYAKMSVSKALDPIGNKTQNNYFDSKSKSIKQSNIEEMEILIFPNPTIDKATISFGLKENEKIKIDIFSLSGAFIENIINDQKQEGKQNVPFNLSAYAPGVYLIRLQVGNIFSTKQVVKMN